MTQQEAEQERTMTAMGAIDDWFRNKVMHLAETHHSARIARDSKREQASIDGYALACATRDEMIVIVGGVLHEV